MLNHTDDMGTTTKPVWLMIVACWALYLLYMGVHKCLMEKYYNWGLERALELIIFFILSLI